MTAPPTERLYYPDAYRTTFTAAVVDRSDDGTRVYLDATAFYPTSGGQPHDLGALGGVAVVDVVDEGDRIAHVLAQPLDANGSDRRRIDRLGASLRSHAAAHRPASALRGVRGSVRPSTPSASTSVPTTRRWISTASSSRYQQLVAAEARANEIVAESRPVVGDVRGCGDGGGLAQSVGSRGHAARRLDRRHRPKRVRRNARSLHRRNRRGARSRRRRRFGRATRVEFVCGARAIRRARRDFESLTKIAGSLSASLDDAPSLVAAQAERLKEGDTARKKLEKELATYRARELYDAATPAADGVRTIVDSTTPRRWTSCARSRRPHSRCRASWSSAPSQIRRRCSSRRPRIRASTRDACSRSGSPRRAVAEADRRASRRAAFPTAGALDDARRRSWSAASA